MLIAVCDDEKVIRDQIELFIREQKNEYSVVHYDSGERLLSNGKFFDLVFLDIQMEGRNGIDIARELRSRKKCNVLIFVTGAKEYVFEAFDVSAFHYLLKPLEERKFTEIFNRAKALIDKSKSEEALILKSKGKYIRIYRDNILYIESRARKVEVHTVTGIEELYASMASLEEKLGEMFYCCYKGIIVNLAYIEEYDREKVVLTNGEILYLSRRKYSEFVKVYLQYLRSGGKLYG